MPDIDIAFLLGSPDISGGSNVIFEHAAGLVRRGHRVTIVTERPFDPERLRWHAAAQTLDFSHHEACRDRVFDVAIATWWRTVFDLPWVPARRLAYFVQSIETRFAGSEDAESQALADFGYRLPLPVVTEATWVATYLRTHYGRDTVVVPNGIHKALFRPEGPVVDATRPHGLRVLVEGRPEVHFKRVPLAIALCRQAGIRDLWLLTSADVTEWPGVSRVFARIPLEDVPAIYRSCDVLVKLSTVEGMFGPPLEMMHCGGTCVTSDVTGHEEYVRDEENALVIPIGAETGVVRALRRLAADGALLQRLKDGARATALAWPSWDEAVSGMEGFVRGVAHAPADPAALRSALLEVLRAALQLAAPLRAAHDRDRAAWYFEYPERTLLKIARLLTRRVVGRALARAGLRRVWTPVTPIALPLPPPRGSGPRRARPDLLRICFVGDPQRHRAHAPLCASGFASTFVPLGTRVDRATLSAVRAYSPDWTVLFVPEGLPEALAAAWCSPLVGVVTKRLDSAARHQLRASFPLQGSYATWLVHPDASETASLLADGVNAIATFLPPLDPVFVAHEDAWPAAARPIPVLIAAEHAATLAPVGAALAGRLNVLALPAVPSEDMLAPVLRATRIVLYPAEIADAPMAAAKLIRDMAAGCLVIGPPLTNAHGLMPGEHYLIARCPEEAERAVHAVLLGPERGELVRRVGHEHARRLARAERWLDLFDGLSAVPPASEAGCEE